MKKQGDLSTLKAKEIFFNFLFGVHTATIQYHRNIGECESNILYFGKKESMIIHSDLGLNIEILGVIPLQKKRWIYF